MLQGVSLECLNEEWSFKNKVKMEEEIYCHEKLKNEALGVSENYH